MSPKASNGRVLITGTCAHCRGNAGLSELEQKRSQQRCRCDNEAAERGRVGTPSPPDIRTWLPDALAVSRRGCSPKRSCNTGGADDDPKHADRNKGKRRSSQNGNRYGPLPYSEETRSQIEKKNAYRRSRSRCDPQQQPPRSPPSFIACEAFYAHGPAGVMRVPCM